MPIMGAARFEELFRRAAELDLDKSDLKRFGDFINQKLYDLLLIGQAVAKANDRNVIELYDLPITKGFQESIHRFRLLDMSLDLEPILDQLASLPALDLDYSFAVREKMPELAGGLAVSLAGTFRILEPDLKNPGSEDWDKAFALFNLIL